MLIHWETIIMKLCITCMYNKLIINIKKNRGKKITYFKSINYHKKIKIGLVRL